MTQKEIVKSVIHDTLYKRLTWKPEGHVASKAIKVRKAHTHWKGMWIHINFKNSTILVNDKEQRLPKDLASDLITLIKLKVTKTLKRNVSYT